MTTTERTNVKLLPCSHCGSTDVALVRSLVCGDVTWRVECRDCGIRTAEYEEDLDVETIWDDASEELENDAIECAVNMWNSRVSIDIEEEEEKASAVDVKAIAKNMTEAKKHIDEFIEWMASFCGGDNANG